MMRARTSFMAISWRHDVRLLVGHQPLGVSDIRAMYHGCAAPANKRHPFLARRDFKNKTLIIYPTGIPGSGTVGMWRIPRAVKRVPSFPQNSCSQYSTSSFTKVYHTLTLTLRSRPDPAASLPITCRAISNLPLSFVDRHSPRAMLVKTMVPTY